MITATEIFYLNELGKRANNEDTISPEKGVATLSDNLFIVCDGVGGENKGEIASEIVCTSIRDSLKKEKYIAGKEKEAIQEAIQYANQKLLAYAANDSFAKRMSTTLALVLLGEKSVITAWCGDTRIHHIRKGTIIWKSKDHSLVSELVSRGELTEQEAKIHPKKHVITRCLNALNTNNTVDFHEIKDVETDDYFLLCTDGLLEKINDEVISQILNDENEKDKAKCFFSYCDGVTKDNFSMYLIKGRYIQKKKNQLASYRFILFFFLLLLSLICLVVIFLKG